MKKLFYLLCLLTLVSCEQPQGIEGEWSRKEKEQKYSMLFNKDGTYEFIGPKEESCFFLTDEIGEYLFAENKLYIFHSSARDYADTLIFNVSLRGSELTFFYNAGVIQYWRE